MKTPFASFFCCLRLETRPKPTDMKTQLHYDVRPKWFFCSAYQSQAQHNTSVFYILFATFPNFTDNCWVSVFYVHTAGCMCVCWLSVRGKTERESAAGIGVSKLQKTTTKKCFKYRESIFDNLIVQKKKKCIKQFAPNHNTPDQETFQITPHFLITT